MTFAEPVSASAVKYYYDVIRNPMDLQTIAARVRG